MNIRLLAFATASDALGTEERDLELAEGSTVADLKALLGNRYPELAALWPRLAVAVDGKIAGNADPLSAGCEVALLPPVSGGSEGLKAALVDQPIDVATVAERVSGPERGAVVLFLGTVRNHHQGREVARLSYTGYRPMALARLERIVEELEAVDPTLRLAITHRLGDLEPGEPSVVIAAASPHRAAAYTASRDALERLKAEVPIWKREHYADGDARWREEESLVAATVGTRPG